MPALRIEVSAIRATRESVLPRASSQFEKNLEAVDQF
jgi:hypothetical protein